MAEIIQLPARTFTAKLFKVPFETAQFKLAGTLDGFVDLAVPKGGTYPLSIEEARLLVIALNGAISDVQENCLYERDQCLVGS